MSGEVDLPNDAVDLVAECLRIAEEQGERELEAFLAGHPDREQELRRVLGSLAGAGMVRGRARDEPFVDKLGEFTLLERIGQGGMGVVFLAKQESVDRLVALKVIHPHFASSAKIAERFRREAQAVAKLTHPNIVTVFGSGEEAGLLYMAMELVPGRGLDDVLLSSRPDARDVLVWIRDIARALHHAHANGVVHRDVKPSNIRIAEDARAMLLDFGLARAVDVAAMTLTGTFQGSPHYAPPEQISPEGAAIGPWSDVYSLGVTLFEAVSGRVPFEGRTTEQVFHGVLHEAPRIGVSSTNIPRDLETVILKAIEKSPQRRYASAERFADDLDALLEFRPIRARPPSAGRRAMMWARRNRVLATTLIAAVLLLAALIVQGRWSEASRRRKAAQALADARGRLDGYASRRPAVLELETRAGRRERRLYRYLDFEARKRQAADERALESMREQRDNALDEVLALVDLATQLDPGIAGTRDVRADVFMERWRIANANDSRESARLLRDMVVRLDPDERHLDELAGDRTVRFRSSPEGADVWLFRYEEQSSVRADGEPRLVPVPAFGAPSPTVAPGTWCLRVGRGLGEVLETDLITEVAGHPIEHTILVVEGSGDVQRFDRLRAIDGVHVRSMYDVDKHARAQANGDQHEFLFERDGETFTAGGATLEEIGVEVAEPARAAEIGGAQARIYRNGQTSLIVLPGGLRVRTTAAPFLLAPSCHLGLTPVDAKIPSGPYGVVLVRDGYEVARVPMDLRRSTERAQEMFCVALSERGTGPDGFVLVSRWDWSCNRKKDFWIMEREVTCAEYLEFLNDPETIARVDRAAPTPVLFPRELSNALDGGYWKRTDDRFTLTGPWRPRTPVLGVSWNDAREYARWLTRRAAAGGEPWHFDLPTKTDYLTAWGCYVDTAYRRYSYGTRFQPTFQKSCFSRDKPCREPVMRFPVDESPWGVFDLTGSAEEWCRDWFWEEQRQRRLFGGSWGHADPMRFSGGRGDGEDAVMDTYGFRLVARASGR